VALVADFFAAADFVGAFFAESFFAGDFVAAVVFLAGLLEAVFFERAGAIGHSIWIVRCECGPNNFGL
jgi:hypothetical protein